MKHDTPLKAQFMKLSNRLSQICETPKIRFVLLAAKWGSILFLILDLIILGRSIGNTTLLLLVFTSAVTSVLTTQKKENKEQKS